MPLYWGGVEPLKGDCSGHIGHVGSYEECAGNKSSNNETDQCDYDDCNKVFSMAVGLARRWHSIALLRIRIVLRVCSTVCMDAPALVGLRLVPHAGQ